MNVKSVLSFLPLFVFGVVGHLCGVGLIGWVAVVCAALALASVIVDRRNGIDPIAFTALVVIAALAAVAFAGGSDGASFVFTYGSGLVALVTGTVMLVSAVTVPFTERVARRSIPQQFWASPQFRAVNKKISTGWGVAVVGLGLCRMVSIALGSATTTGSGGLLGIVLDWVAPIALCYAAIRYSSAVAARAKAAHAHAIDDRPVSAA